MRNNYLSNIGRNFNPKHFYTRALASGGDSLTKTAMGFKRTPSRASAQLPLLVAYLTVALVAACFLVAHFTHDSGVGNITYHPRHSEEVYASARGDQTHVVRAKPNTWVGHSRKDAAAKHDHDMRRMEEKVEMAQEVLEAVTETEEAKKEEAEETVKMTETAPQAVEESETAATTETPAETDTELATDDAAGAPEIEAAPGPVVQDDENDKTEEEENGRGTGAEPESEPEPEPEPEPKPELEPEPEREPGPTQEEEIAGGTAEETITDGDDESRTEAGGAANPEPTLDGPAAPAAEEEAVTITAPVEEED